MFRDFFGDDDTETYLQDNDATEVDNNDGSNDEEEERNLVTDTLVEDAQREDSSRDVMEKTSRTHEKTGKMQWRHVSWNQ